MREYVSEPPSDELIASVEEELGYKLPQSYITLMKLHNGGIPVNTCFPTKRRTSWAGDHVAITGIFGIGRDKKYSLGGDLGSGFMIEEWGYPAIGVCICDCPSAGHDIIMLDYRKCGQNGEPAVVHVDQEADYRITYLAKNFEAFIRGLVSGAVYDTSAEDLREDLRIIDDGRFSDDLANLISRQTAIDFGAAIRKICRQLTVEKGYFSLHADELSYLLYDIQFLLYSRVHKVSANDYLQAYPSMIVFGNGELRTGGYAPGFVYDWLVQRINAYQIVQDSSGGLRFTPEFEQELSQKLAVYQ